MNIDQIKTACQTAYLQGILDKFRTMSPQASVPTVPTVKKPVVVDQEAAAIALLTAKVKAVRERNLRVLS